MSVIEPSRGDLRARVERELRIPALPATVWRFLSTNEGWAAWWGPGSQIEPRVEIRWGASPPALCITSGLEPAPPGVPSPFRAELGIASSRSGRGSARRF
jgi:hypothetical protein